MTTRLPILDGDQWARVIAFARDLNIPDAENQSDTVLGIRLGNVLKANGWTQFLSMDFDRACTVIREHYAAKQTRPDITEEQAFEDGLEHVWYNVAAVINLARKAYEYSQSKNPKAALRGLSRAYGRNAEHMALAYQYWGADWFAETNPRAQTPQECLTLFALASLPKEQAEAAYLYWRDHLSLTYFQMLEYIADLKNKKRLKDFEEYPTHRRTTLRGLKKMQDTAKGERQEVIQGVIETVREKL